MERPAKRVRSVGFAEVEISQRDIGRRESGDSIGHYQGDQGPRCDAVNITAVAEQAIFERTEPLEWTGLKSRAVPLRFAYAGVRIGQI